MINIFLITAKSFIIKTRNITLIWILFILNIQNSNAQIQPRLICPATALSTDYVYSGPSDGMEIITVTSRCTGYLITNNVGWVNCTKDNYNVTIEFSTNFGPERTGHITIGGLTLTVSQGCGNFPATAGSITGYNSVCSGQNSVNYYVAPISGATGYSWTLPTGATIATGSNTNSITVNYASNAVSGNITVRGTGCGSGSTSPNYYVTVYSIGEPGSISGDNFACSGSTHTYSISAVSGATYYTWSLPPGASGTSSSNSINVTFGTEPGYITVSAHNSLCSSSTSTNLLVGIPSLVQYNVSGGGTICQGATAQVSLAGSYASASYNLYLNGSLLHSEPGTGYGLTWYESSAGTYTVKGVTQEGCEFPMIGSASILLRTPSTPATSITANPSAICPGGSSTLTLNGGSLESGYGVWKWYSGTCGSILVGTGPSITVSPSVTTTYFVRAEGGCISTSCTSTNVTIKLLPSITSQPVNSDISLGSDATFSVTATGPNLQYQWQVSPNGVDNWTDLSGLPAQNYQTANLTIKGSTTFEDNSYKCKITSDCSTIYSSVVKIVVDFPNTSYLYDIPDPETRVLNTTYLVGSTAGGFNTNSKGGASYSIPLNAPPGVNGLNPNLSINYSSDGSSGIPGFGWQLNGISSISLGPRTAFNDGRADGSCDRFYLDGQRLVPNKSSSVYGAADTQYQTENDIFTRITPQNVDMNNGPSWFRSETKSGLVFEYGNTQSSKQIISNNPKVLNWYVSKVSDQFGNDMNFTYIQDHYSVYPSEISYGPNQVTFYYKLRTDKNTSLSNGVKIEQWLLLDKIVIKYNSTVIKTYEFNYSYQGSIYNSYSILNEVIEYGIGANRLNSTVFAYQIPENVVFTQTLYNQTDNYVNYKSKLITGDFNGDGKADLLCIPDPAKQATWTGVRVYFGDGADYFTNPIISSISFDLTKLKDIRVMDLNSDGIDDILYEYTNSDNPSNSDFNYILCNGTSLAQPVLITTKLFNAHTGLTGKIRRNGISQEDDNERLSKSFISPAMGKNNLSSMLPPKSKSIVDSDFDGDGINDVFINDPSGNIQIWTYSLDHMLKICDFTWNTLTSDILSGDFNGDGKTDIWSFTSSGLKIYNYISYSVLNYIFSDPWPTNQHYFTLGDFNADGKVDIFLYGYKDTDGTEYDWPNWQIRLSNGSGFDLHDIPQKKANLKNDNVRTGDFNGDGANDIMVNSKNLSWSGTYFYISTNSGTDLYTNSLPAYPLAVNNYYLADFNGDGSTDFICTSGVSTYWTGYQVYKSVGKTSILMNKIANGLGSLTKINYATLSQAPSTIYQKDPVAAAFPVMDFQGPWSIVSSVQVDNGKGSMNTLNYNYMGAKVHLQGKGFLGYSKTMITDIAAAIDNESISSYNTAYFYPTLLKTLLKRTGTTDTIEKVTNKWSHMVLESSYGRIFPYVSSSTHVNKLTGLSVTSSAQFDDSGNMTVSTTNYLNGPTVTTTNRYDDEKNDTYHWLLGRPTSTTIDYSGSSPTITRSGSRVFDQTSNNLVSETWYTGANQITKEYEYNTNGTFKNVSAIANGETRLNSCTYTPDNIRIYTSTDQLSHINTNTYDTYGRLYTQQDYLGNIVTHLYDNMGRESSISSSDGSEYSIVYSWEDPTVNPLLSRYSIQKTSIDGSITKSWFDKLGRELRLGVKGFDGTMIYTSTIYNIIGQVESVTDPYYSTDTGLLNSFLYDLYGRRTSQTRPSGRNTTLSYNNNTVTETTAGKSFSKTLSSDGTISSATDAGGTLTYTYYPDGKVKTITAPGGIVTSMHYDAAGNQDQLVDPSVGTIAYTYNGFGELVSQINPGPITTTINYNTDGSGTINNKITIEGTTFYIYNTNKQLTYISSPGNMGDSIWYDTKGRIIKSTKFINGSPFRTSITYDTKGRISTVKHPSGIIETKNYNLYGYLNSVSTNGIERWSTTALNARQQVTAGQYWKSGGNLSATFGYDLYGFPTSTVSGTIQNNSYNFDPVLGNLTWRQNNKYTGLKETFQYDNLDRLSTVYQDTTLTLNMGYDVNNGGITTKNDVGTILYNDSSHPYAVSDINPKTSLTPTEPQTITYSSFNAVNTIAENNYIATITYGSDNQRAQMIVKQGTSTILTRWYPTASYIKETAGSTTKEYTFIGGDSYTARIVAVTESGTTTYYDLLRDYLGNITHVVNATTGTVTAEYSFDSWGRMRNPSTWAYYAPGSEPTLFIAGRGFTGHEHLPWFNLINMNGRVYDALVGMFLSPDNYVQNAGLTQNFNRYSYCLNNPLSNSDPSGYNYMQLENMVYDNPIRQYGQASSGRWGICLNGAPGFEENMASKGYVYMKNKSGIASWFKISLSWQTVSLGPGKPDLIIKKYESPEQGPHAYNRYRVEIIVKGKMFEEYNFVQTKKREGEKSYELDRGWDHNHGFYYTNEEQKDNKYFTNNYYSKDGDGYFEDFPNGTYFDAELTILGRNGEYWSIIQNINWGYVRANGSFEDYFNLNSGILNEIHQENVDRTLHFWNNVNNIH